jgi:hypothetical protein
MQLSALINSQYSALCEKLEAIQAAYNNTVTTTAAAAAAAAAAVTAKQVTPQPGVVPVADIAEQERMQARIKKLKEQVSNNIAGGTCLSEAYYSILLLLSVVTEF